MDHTLKKGLMERDCWDCQGQKEGLRMSVLQPNTKLGTAYSGNQKCLLWICMELYTFRSPFPFILPTAHLASKQRSLQNSFLDHDFIYVWHHSRLFLAFLFVCLFYFLAISYSPLSARPSRQLSQGSPFWF